MRTLHLRGRFSNGQFVLLNPRLLTFSYRNLPRFFSFPRPTLPFESFFFFSVWGWPASQKPLEGSSVNKGNSSGKACSPGAAGHRRRAPAGLAYFRWEVSVILASFGVCLSAPRWVLGAPVYIHGGYITRKSGGAGKAMKAGGNPLPYPQFWIIKQQSHCAERLDSQGMGRRRKKKAPSTHRSAACRNGPIASATLVWERVIVNGNEKKYICTTFQHFLVHHLT